MKVRITNIQRFCLSDGPGIRTTVFLKGCNLKCPWCANPENIEYEFNDYIKDNGEKGIFGYDIELENLFEEIMKDKEYYKMNNGGVTFSGGEPLLQIKRLEPILKKLKENKINICFETALNIPKDLLLIAIKYACEFIIDIKILDGNLAKNILNCDIDLYYDNLNTVYEKSLIESFRIPVTNEYTLNDDNINAILTLLKKVKSKNVEIFKVHNLAKSKYNSLGKKMQIFSEVSNEELLNLKGLIENIGCNVKINTL